MELCKKIPAGEFTDSALVWMLRPALEGFSDDPFMVDYRIKAEYLERQMHSAPTLEEIRRELRNLSVAVYENTIVASCKIDPETWVSETVNPGEHDADAALRIWLKLKGVIYFAVTFILLAFDKNGFAILAFCIGCLLCFAKRVVQRVERRIKEKENSR